MPPILTSMGPLLERYSGILLDAYGVLVDVSGPLPGALELITLLARTGKPYAICSNDASRLPTTYAARFARAGLTIPPARITSAAMLLAPYFAAHRLSGARVAVLGTSDSNAMVTAAGGEVVPLRADMEIDALAVCDDDGFDFKEGLDLALSAVARAVTQGRPIHLVLPNPDIMYPKSRDELGFTAGGMAVMIEAGLARRFPDRELRFDRLGKPAPDLLTLARTQVLGGMEPSSVLMVGDQVETDIAAAQAAGLDSALVDGISRWKHVSATLPRPADGAAHAATSPTPTYLLPSVAP
jgi:HAD superfamily hydrolase (TIGR01450 family)